MAGSKYNWDKIYSDTKQIISGCIENKKAVPTFLSKMHQILEKDARLFPQSEHMSKKCVQCF